MAAKTVKAAMMRLLLTAAGYCGGCARQRAVAGRKAGPRRYHGSAGPSTAVLRVLDAAARFYGVGHLLHAALEALSGGKGRFFQLPTDNGRDDGQHGYQAEQEQG